MNTIDDIEWLNKKRNNDIMMKAAAVVMFISAFTLILIMSSGFINLYKNQDRINMERSKEIVRESSETAVIELCVVDKRVELYGLTGILNKYVLVLSNERLVYVKKSDFWKYEKDQFYDFTVTETTTVSQWVTAN